MNEMQKRYHVIGIDGRVGRIPTRLYITRVSYRPGDGSIRVAKIAYHQDRSRAQEFSTYAATAIADYLKSCGYAPHVEEK